MRLDEQCIRDELERKGYLESIYQSPRTDSPTISREGGHDGSWVGNSRQLPVKEGQTLIFEFYSKIL